MLFFFVFKILFEFEINDYSITIKSTIIQCATYILMYLFPIRMTVLACSKALIWLAPAKGVDVVSLTTAQQQRSKSAQAVKEDGILGW